MGQIKESFHNRIFLTMGKMMGNRILGYLVNGDETSGHDRYYDKLFHTDMVFHSFAGSCFLIAMMEDMAPFCTGLLQSLR